MTGSNPASRTTERWQRGRLRSVANRVSGDATEVRILDVPPVCVQRGESALTLRGIAERVGSGGVAVTRVSHRRADAPGVQSVERPSTEGVLRLGWPRGPGPPSEGTLSPRRAPWGSPCGALFNAPKRCGKTQLRNDAEQDERGNATEITVSPAHSGATDRNRTRNPLITNLSTWDFPDSRATSGDTILAYPLNALEHAERTGNG